MKEFAKILVNLPLEGPFDYKIPKAMVDKIQIGARVWVSFGVKRLVGFVVDFASKSNISSAKTIEELIDEEPILSSEMLKFTKEISNYYFCTWGEAIEAAIPSSLKKGKTKVVARNKDIEEKIKPSTHFTLTKEQEEALLSITNAMTENKHRVFLLHGITGSGKTEVYLPVSYTHLTLPTNREV